MPFHVAEALFLQKKRLQTFLHLFPKLIGDLPE